MTATWEVGRLEGRPGRWYSVRVARMWLDVYRDGRDWLAHVTIRDRLVSERRCRTSTEAKAAAVALALEVLDEMRRAVEGLR